MKILYRPPQGVHPCPHVRGFPEISATWTPYLSFLSPRPSCQELPSISCHCGWKAREISTLHPYPRPHPLQWHSLLTWVPGHVHMGARVPVARLSWGGSLRSSQQGAQRGSLPLEGQAEDTGISEGPWDRGHGGTDPGVESCPGGLCPRLIPTADSSAGTWQHLGSD